MLLMVTRVVTRVVTRMVTHGNAWYSVSFLDVRDLFKVQLQLLTHEVAQLPR